MSAMNALSDDVLRAAGEWVLELQSPDITVERIAAWQQWLARDLRHARAFEQLQQTWNLADGLREVPAILELSQAAPSQRRSRTWRSGLGLAAALVVAIGAASFWWFQQRGATVLETAVGEHRDLHLADGSQVSIGAGSLLRVSMDEHRRRIELIRGEAYFQVARDPARPFSVRGGAMSVTALGTAFNVRRTGEWLVVGVSEGTVAVSARRESFLEELGVRRPQAATHPQLVTAGQRLSMETTRPVAQKVEAVAPRAIGSWRTGRLQYSGEPLAVVIADVNRYVDKPIVITDPSIAALRVTGTVSENNVTSWLTSLQASLPIEVVEGTEGRWELRKPR